MEHRQAIVFLGRKLFNLYKEKYPDITSETTLEIVPFQYIEFGARILLPSEQPFNPKTISTTMELQPYVDVKPSNFERWAADQYSPHYLLAFIKELDCIFAYRI